MTFRPRLAGAAAALTFMLAVLSACGELPPEDKVSLARTGTAEAAQTAGTNAVGEACRYEPVQGALGAELARGYSVFCGTWQQPSGVVFVAARAAAVAELPTVALQSPWRTGLDQRVACDAPKSTTLLNDVPAELMSCKRKSGGWPHVAFVANVRGSTYFVDGVPSAVPALETVLAQLSGEAIPAGTVSGTQQLSAAIAAHPFGSGDLDTYFTLMRLGNAANDASDYAAAEQAFRRALAIQERLLGPADAGLATPIMDLALQISNQGRFVEADQLFARVAQMVNESSDGLVKARYDLYIAEHEVNRFHFDQASAANTKAQAEFRDFVPQSLIAIAYGNAPTVANAVVDAALLGPDGARAVSGLAASLNLDALIAYRKGDHAQVQTMIARVDALLRASDLNPPGVKPRALRLAALTAQQQGDASDAVHMLGTAADLFAKYGANVRPVVMTRFQEARTAVASGDSKHALALYRQAAKIALDQHLGLPEPLVSTYLVALDEAAKAQGADRAALAEEFFDATQLIQGNVTGQFVAQAFARLAANEPNARALLRQLQDADLELQRLYAQRDQETRQPDERIDKAKLASIDEQIAKVQAARNEADSAAQSASPGYARLVANAATLADVRRVLGPKEALVVFTIGLNASFGILVEAGQVTEYRIPLDAAAASEAVSGLRKTIEPQTVNGRTKLPTFDVVAAHRLYETLFAPVAERLQDLDRLVIVPSGALTSLPLEVLVTRDTPPVTNGDYRKVPFLITQLAVNYMPSPQTLVVLREHTQPSTAKQPYIGFGDFHPATREQVAATFPPATCTMDFLALNHLASLPGTRKEIMAAGGMIFHAPPDAIVLGADFTKARLFAANLSQYRIVHLATHGILATSLSCRPEPLIALSADPKAKDANDAFLGMSEVLSLKLDADLVLLSACNTAGPGGAGAGDSLSGLAKAFFFAGARGLMVTHWELEDTAGPVLTALALSPTGAVRDTTEDLRRAKLYMILDIGSRPGPGFAFFTHPFAWAPFVLVGDGIRAPPKTS
jgi:CHAT domain-containing protein